METPSPIAVSTRVIAPGSETFSPETINARFYDWARAEPEEALVAATHIHQPGVRRLAIQSALSGWARKDPSTLAETALAFPDGEEKTAAFTKAFRAWMVDDPKVAGAWLQAHPEQLALAEQVLRTASR